VVVPVHLGMVPEVPLPVTLCAFASPALQTRTPDIATSATSLRLIIFVLLFSHAYQSKVTQNGRRLTID